MATSSTARPSDFYNENFLLNDDNVIAEDRVAWEGKFYKDYCMNKKMLKCF